MSYHIFILQMGMKRMFTDDAEFHDLIEGSVPVKISQVKHKSVIEVDEEGTVATSGTEGKPKIKRSLNFIIQF